MRKFNWDNTWHFGSNFIPSTAINQLEMWQAETFDRKPYAANSDTRQESA